MQIVTSFVLLAALASATAVPPHAPANNGRRNGPLLRLSAPAGDSGLFGFNDGAGGFPDYSPHMFGHNDITNVNYDEIYGDHASNIYSLYASASSKLKSFSMSSSASAASASAIASALAAKPTQVIQFPQPLQTPQPTIVPFDGQPAVTVVQAQGSPARTFVPMAQPAPFMDLPLVDPQQMQAPQMLPPQMQMLPPQMQADPQQMFPQTQMTNQGGSGGVSVVSVIPGTAFVAPV
ncbi:hypothetical protein FBU59_004991, partial [Linderina macrospora]